MPKLSSFSCVTAGKAKTPEAAAFRALHEARIAGDAEKARDALSRLETPDTTPGVKPGKDGKHPTVASRIKAGRRSCYRLIPLDENGEEFPTYGKGLPQHVMDIADGDTLLALQDSIRACIDKRAQADREIRALILGADVDADDDTPALL